MMGLGVKVTICEGQRRAEQVSRLEVEGYFDEKELTAAIEEWAATHGGVWTIKCLRRYASA